MCAIGLLIKKKKVRTIPIIVNDVFHNSFKTVTGT